MSSKQEDNYFGAGYIGEAQSPIATITPEKKYKIFLNSYDLGGDEGIMPDRWLTNEETMETSVLREESKTFTREEITNIIDGNLRYVKCEVCSINGTPLSISESKYDNIKGVAAGKIIQAQARRMSKNKDRQID